MDLLLWRHAEAADGFPDEKRQLTPHGKKQAQRMATWLSQNAPKNLRILVSPATRTQQTVQAWTDQYETTPLVGLDSHADTVLRAAHWPDSPTAVLIVGHEPTLGIIATTLLSGNQRPHSHISFKKGALWWFKSREREGSIQTVLHTSISADAL